MLQKLDFDEFNTYKFCNYSINPIQTRSGGRGATVPSRTLAVNNFFNVEVKAAKFFDFTDLKFTWEKKIARLVHGTCCYHGNYILTGMFFQI